MATQNWIVTANGDTINLDYVSRIQKDGSSIYFVLGQNVYTGTSGSNCILTETYGSSGEADTAYDTYISILKSQGRTVDLR